YTSLSRIHGERGELPEELLYAEDAVILARDIASRDATDAGGPEGLNSALLRLATARTRAGQSDVAQANAREALDLARGLVAEFPDDLYYEEILFSSLLTLAESTPGQDDAACRAAEEAGELYVAISAGGVSSSLLQERGEVRLPAVLERHCG
ncbi:MAG: hypothetical protein AAF638_04260, partial [Pseudomonadota bacterium]